jgi:DNA-binding phage protein
MALTKSLKELMQSRVARDPDFAAALLREGIDTKLTGDVATSKAILRDYIKATAGFEKLGEATNTPAKSLLRMFGPRGNPRARNVSGVIGLPATASRHRTAYACRGRVRPRDNTRNSTAGATFARSD